MVLGDKSTTYPSVTPTMEAVRGNFHRDVKKGGIHAHTVTMETVHDFDQRGPEGQLI